MYTVAAVLYGIPVFLTKLSILLQYLRIFNPHTYKRTNLMFWAPYALIWTNLGFYLVTSLIAIFGCKPIAKAWDPLITRGHCLNRHATAIAVAIINCLTDFMILVLPLRAIWNLQIPRRKKLAISSVFLVGVL